MNRCILHTVFSGLVTYGMIIFLAMPTFWHPHVYQEVCTKNVNLGQLLKCKEDRTVYHVIQHNNKVLRKIKIAIKSGIYITHFPLNIRSVATKQN